MGMTGEQAYVLAKKLIEAGGGGGGTVDAYTKTQTNNLLNQKVDKEVGKGLFSGSYNDLLDAPTIPSKTSELQNDSGYLTENSNTISDINASLNDIKNTLAPKQSVVIKDLYNVSSYTLPCDGYLFMNSWGVFSYTINIDDVFTFILTNNSPQIPIFLKAGTQIKLSNVNNEGGHLDFAGYQN